MNNLEKAADDYIEKSENVLEYCNGWEDESDWEYVRKAYISGANWMKEQMMKDAVIATVTSLPNDWGEYMPIIEISVDVDYQEGSKVKVLIIKEE